MAVALSRVILERDCEPRIDIPSGVGVRSVSSNSFIAIAISAAMALSIRGVVLLRSLMGAQRSRLAAIDPRIFRRCEMGQPSIFDPVGKFSTGKSWSSVVRRRWLARMVWMS